MWESRTKNDLIIEVWEKLDCENVGRPEIEAIEVVVAEQFGSATVDSPMIIARLLADEGAELRHSEIMELYVERASDRPYDAVFRNILRIETLASAERTIQDLENLRRKYKTEDDKQGLRLTIEAARRGKAAATEAVGKQNIDGFTRLINAEIEQWFTVWLQTPDVFVDWLALRKRSADFADKFGRSS